MKIVDCFTFYNEFDLLTYRLNILNPCVDYFVIVEARQTFIGKEKIELYGKSYDVEHFKLTSKDMSIPKDKRLNFDIWFDKKNALILKVAYSRMGNWEYRVKKFE